MISILTAQKRHSQCLFTAITYLILAVVVYLPVLIHGSLLADDFILLAGARHGDVGWASHGSGFYRPLAGWVLLCLWRTLGLHFWAYHFVGLLLLVCTALNIQSISLHINCKYGGAAWATGAAFVVWAPHSEAVSWISGLTDVLSVYLASAALLAFVWYRERPSPSKFAVVLVLLWLALTAKEPIALWPAILALIGIFIWPPTRHNIKSRAAECFALGILTVSYVFWRAHVIGGFGGGTGPNGLLGADLPHFYAAFGLHCANAFFPINKLVAQTAGLPTAYLLTTVVVVGSGALILRRLPRKDRQSPWSAAFGLSLIIAGLAHPFNWFLPFGDLDWRLHVDNLMEAILVLMAIRRIDGRQACRILHDPLALFAASIVAIGIHLSGSDNRNDILILFGFLWFAFATRPPSTAPFQPDGRVKLAFAAYISAFLAMGLTVFRWVDINGEFSRYSYGPSLFAVLGLASLGCLCISNRYLQVAFTSLVLGVLGYAQFENNVAWSDASSLSDQTAMVIHSLGRTRRMYVLAAPYDLSGALVFPVGIEWLGETALDDDSIQIEDAILLKGGHPRDVAKVRVAGNAAYRLTIEVDQATIHLSGPSFVKPGAARTTGWFRVAGDTVTLIGFDPRTDHVMVIDGTGARVIR